MPSGDDDHRIPNAVNVVKMENHVLVLHYYEERPDVREALARAFGALGPTLRRLPHAAQPNETVLAQIHVHVRSDRVTALFIDGEPTLRSARVQLPTPVADYLRAQYPAGLVPADNQLPWADYDVEVQAMRNFLNLLYDIRNRRQA